MADGPNPDDVTPPAQDDATSGTPAAEDTRNAEADDNQKKLLHSLQEKAARVNDAERRAQSAEAEVDRLRRAQSPAAPGPGITEKQQRYREAHAWSTGTADPEKGVDPASYVALDAAAKAYQLEQQMAERDALDEIDDAALRKQVKQHLANNRNQGRELDVGSAIAEVRASRIEEMETENKRLAEALRVAQQPPGNAPPTHHQPVPASTLKARTLTQDQWNDELRGLSGLDRMNKISELEQGKIKLRE